MKVLRQTGLILLVFVLLFQSISLPVFASSDVEKEEAHIIKATIVSFDSETKIPLFKNESEISDILTHLKNEDEVIILQEFEEFSLVDYEDLELDIITQGYVKNKNLELVESNVTNDTDDDTIKTPAKDSDLETLENDLKNQDSEIINSENKDENVNNQTAAENEHLGEDTSEVITEVKELEIEEIVETENTKPSNVIEDGEKQITTNNENTVSIQSASIINLNQEVFQGIALKKPTHVYASQSTQSNQLRSYNQGSVLKYRSLNSQWYEATVSVNGKWTTGYIHVNDVETFPEVQTTYNGIGLKNKTNVYQNASTNSRVLRSYDQGSVLVYRSLTSEWYEATVSVNGKWTTGYIHVNDVETFTGAQTTYNGIGLRNKTNVYQKASTNSSVLKSYNQGTILKYKSLTSNWYEATVFINGQRQTGFIHHDHVENSVENPVTLNGIGIKNRTAIYSNASTASKQLKSYPVGSILKYRTFSSNWYEATVYVNGIRKTGYIHRSHVVNHLPGKQESLEGRALINPTSVYSRASKSSNVLRSYNKGRILKFKTLSKDWYEATVYINGAPTTGYIHTNDVALGDITNYTKYNYSFEDMVNIQMTRTPKADGAGLIPATREQVAYYANPLNFLAGTTEYLQFLVLNQTTGMSAKEINDKVLYNKDILIGQGQAFIDAGNRYNINEAYLIAHVLHETGNGTSTLAKGIPVDKNGNVTRDSKGNIVENSNTVHTVYNMYGYGAYDDTPIESGSMYAFNQKWFTPADAIVGGAESVANKYINKGQDTLYKMRWNPASPGYPQYATHVAWATLQTRRINEIYKLIDNYTLVFDIPQFSNTPSQSEKPGNTESDKVSTNFPMNVFGINTSNLNYRTGPETSNSSLGVIPTGTKFEIIGEGSNGWYYIKYNGKNGWVSGSYVEILNLLEVTATNLNVRPTPNASTSLGQVSNTLLAGVLNSNNKLTKNGVWYKVYYNGQQAWVSGGNNGTQYIKTH